MTHGMPASFIGASRTSGMRPRADRALARHRQTDRHCRPTEAQERTRRQPSSPDPQTGLAIPAPRRPPHPRASRPPHIPGRSNPIPAGLIRPCLSGGRSSRCRSKAAGHHNTFGRAFLCRTERLIAVLAPFCLDVRSPSFQKRNPGFHGSRPLPDDFHQLLPCQLPCPSCPHLTNHQQSQHQKTHDDMPIPVEDQKEQQHQQGIEDPMTALKH